MSGFVVETDTKVLAEIARKSGSERVKRAANYLRAAKYYSKNFYAERFGDCAFYAVSIAKKHLTIIELAVLDGEHGKGIGGKLLNRIKRLCREKGIDKIRLRTAINETAIEFWLRQGAEIVGLNGEDYELEIKV